MKPITLKFNGINCFTTPQEINFSSLGGIFGIFGPTGSGKTTILDAISIALFGETPRLGGKSYAFINNNANEAMVELCFENEKIYSVKRTYKQKANNIESSAVLMQNEKTIAEGPRDVNAKIAKILKMSSADYSKCIALPQGEFAAFLKSSAAERTALIGKLFGLEQYGENLIKAANNKKSLLEQKCEYTSKQIAAMGENINQQIEELNSLHKSKTELVSALSSQLSVLEQKVQLQKQTNAQYAKYNEIAEKLANLTSKSSKIEQNRELVKKHEIALANKVQLQELKKQIETAAQTAKLLDAAKKEYELANFDLSTLNRNLEEINKKAKTVAESNEIIVELKQLAEKESQAQALAAQQNEIENNIKEKQTEIDSIKSEQQITSQQIEADTLRLNDLNKKLSQVKNQLQEINNAGGEIGTETKKQVLQKVLNVLTQNFDDFQQKNEKLQSEISKTNQTIASNKQKIDTITFQLGITTSVSEKLKETQNKLFEITSAEKQLQFVSQQKALIQIAANSIMASTQQAEAEIQNLTSQLSQKNEQKRKSDENIKAITAEKDKNLVAEAEETVSGETTVGMPCPICGNTVTQVFAPKSANINFYNNSLNLAQKEHEQLLAEIRLLEIKKANQEFKIEELKTQSEELKVRERSLMSLQNKILISFVNITENSLQDFGELKTKTEADQKSLQSANEEIEKYKNEIQKLEQKNLKNGIWYEKNKEIIDLIFNNCEKIRKEIAENQFKILENGKNTNFAQLKTSLQIEEGLLTKQIIALTKEIESHKSQIAIMEQKIAAITDKISDLGTIKSSAISQISAFQNQFNKLCHGYSSVAEKLERVTSAKSSIETEQSRLTAQLKTATLKALECQKNLDIKSNSLDMQNNSIVSQKTMLLPVFEAFSTTDINRILQNILPDFAQISSEIAHYDHTKTLLEHDLALCSKPTEIDTTDYESSVAEIKQQIAENNINIGSLLEQIEAKKQVLIEQNKLKEELEASKEELSTATELCSLLRGKELLAFATEAYLQDITQKASNKLFYLLSGRYTLCYENKEFYVCDNFDNGAKRSCSTLSGGETFVVSLSLALSISETLLAHAAQPNEFFFLDEGFGTLDAELRDVIVDTLMKLNQSGITIGVISHVEELKTEIKNRLIISRETGKNDALFSKITVEQDI